VTAEAQQFDPSQPFTTFDPSKPFTVAEPTPDFRATNEPPSTALKAAAYGKDAMQLALDALPGAGAVIGGVLATPETAGAGTLAGAALGAGAGRGLRDLIGAGLGLQPPTTALREGKAIALDTAETYVAGKILPALWEAIRTPGATVADVFDGMRQLYAASPKAVKAFMPDFEALGKLPRGVGKAPASILTRPAWQTWQDHLPETATALHLDRSVPVPPSVLTPQELSERILSGHGVPTAAAPKPPIGGPVATPPVEAPGVPAAAVAAPSAAAAPVVPVAPTAAAAPAELVPAAASVRPPASAAPVAGLRPTPESAAIAAALPDQRALNEAALAARRAAFQASQAAPAAGPVVPASGKMRLTLPEFKEFQRLIQRGMSLPDAERVVKLARDLGADAPPVAATTFPKMTRGK
jgi:hypothetical protein